ncbi:unnamed protein product [Owenia fusiformis]|uniref:Uncharacterized protein n=1 Tax=Owenia fusiformis TaxID=6347 RepID=A0A8J1XYR6_OWEFU|nr:unnamed protein product [Owenia fusiformis]
MQRYRHNRGYVKPRHQRWQQRGIAYIEDDDDCMDNFCIGVSALSIPDQTETSRNLREAIKDGDIAAVINIAKQGANVSRFVTCSCEDCLYNDGCPASLHLQPTTPLIMSIVESKTDIAAELLKYGADPNITNGLQETPLLHAIWQGNLDLVSHLLKHKADHSQKDSRGVTPIKQACQHGTLAMVKDLLDNGVDINETTVHKFTPLHHAVLGGNADIVEYILDEGANLNVQSYMGDTPFLLAVKLNHIDIVQLFLSKDIDLKFEKQGERSLRESQSSEIMKLLLDKGICAMEVDEWGDSVFKSIIAQLRRDSSDEPFQVLKQMCSHYGYNNLGKWQDVVLHMAVWNCDIEMTKLLLEAGANPNVALDSYYPLITAMENYSDDIFKLLILYGADINPTKGANPFITGCQGDGTYLMLKILYTAGCDLDPLRSWIDEGKAVQKLQTDDVVTWSWIQDVVSQPRSLKQLCGIAIRQLLHQPIYSPTEKLPLPKPLKEYLLFETE